MRVGTRRSPLAQAQCDRVLAQVQGTKVLIESEGDQDAVTPLHRLGTPGAFTKSLTRAVLDGRIDAAVHSLKDLPLESPAEAPVVAVLARDDPADRVLVRREAHDPDRPLGLRPGGRLGTSAPRRQAQALDADATLVPVDVRGNVQTRLRLLEAGVLDGLVMAAAVFDRIALDLQQDVVAVRLDPVRFPNAPGQGVVAVQARPEHAGALRALDHGPTRQAVEAEREVLRLLGGGCGMPLGVHVHQAEGIWHLQATMAHPTGTVRCGLSGPDPVALAAQAAQALAVPPAPAPPPAPGPEAPLVLVALAPDRADAYRRVAAPRYDVRAWPLVETEPTRRPLPEGAVSCAWVAVTSARAAPFAAEASRRMDGPVRLAAVGPATARALRDQGLAVHLVAREGTGAGLAADLARHPARGAVLWPCAEEPAGGLAEGLAAAGIPLVRWPVYRTRAATGPPPVPSCQVLVLTSATAAAAFARHPHRPRAVRLLALGPTTAAAMRKEGLTPDGACPARSPQGLVQALEELSL